MEGLDRTSSIDLTDGSRRFRLNTGLPEAVVAGLVARSRTADPDRSVLILCHPPADGEGGNLYLHSRLVHPGYRARVARFPLPDPLPQAWLPPLAEVDEIWAYSAAGQEALLKAGVSSSRVHVIPPVVAPVPSLAPYPLAGRRVFRLLAFVSPDEGTGWPEAVRAWLGAFSPEEEATLVLAPRPGVGPLPLAARVAAQIRACGRDPAAIPAILLVEEAVDPAVLARLVLAADGVLVPGDEDERGLVALSCMAAGVAPMGFAGGGRGRLLHSSRAFPLASGEPLEPALRRLREAPLERHRRGLAAARYVASSHAPELVARLVGERLAALRARAAPAAAQDPVERVQGGAAGGAARLEAATRDDYRRLRAQGIPADRLAYSPRPLPAAWLEAAPRPHPAWADGRRHLLFAPDRLEESGWEPLLRTFAQAFQGRSDVVLEVVTDEVERVRAALPALMAAAGGHRAPGPVRLHPAPPPPAAGSLLGGATAFLLPTGTLRAWECERRALAAGVPLIVPALGEHLDLGGEPGTARLLCMRPAGEGRWEPDPIDLAQAMVEAVAGRGSFPGMGDRAREEAARSLAPGRLRRGPGPEVVFEGPVFRSGSQALILRELVRALARRPGPALGVRHLGPVEWPPRPAGADAELSLLLLREEPEGVEAVVRGGWPVGFRQPLARRFVLRVDWEWGRIPLSWLAPLETVDRIWVHSEHVRRTFVDSGCPAGKVRILPHGVDPILFGPEGPVLPELAERVAGRHAFLFVGGALFRKGLDLLLAAYARAFTAADPVCLVVKEFGAEDFYRGQGLGRLVDRFAATRGAPALVRAPERLAPEGMGALYRTCHTLVHPYRGEGFGLPVLEAMASALPVVVTAGGATRELAVGDSALLIPAARREVDLPERCAGVPWILEPDVDALARLLKTAVAEREALAAAAAARAGEVRTGWSWDRAAARAAELLGELLGEEAGEHAGHAAGGSTPGRILPIQG